MIIKLKYDYFIEVDEYNFTLKSKRIGKKTNKETFKTHGYYPRLESALKGYIKHATLDINDGYVLELQELLEKIKTVCDETIATIKENL